MSIKLLAAILSMWGYASAATPPAKHSILDRPIIELTVDSGSELVGVCRKLNIPGGEFLHSLNAVGTHAAKVHYKNTTARKILDQVVKQHPDYSWEVDEGVIVLLPHDAPELNRVVGQITISSGPINRLIGSLSARAGLEAADTDMSGWQPSKRTISLTIGKMKLREALNAVVRKDGQAVWTISRVRGETYLSEVEYW